MSVQDEWNIPTKNNEHDLHIVITINLFLFLWHNMIMAWPLKPAPQFSLTIINVYKIKIAFTKLAYLLLFILSAWDWKALQIT